MEIYCYFLSRDHASSAPIYVRQRKRERERERERNRREDIIGIIYVVGKDDDDSES